MPSKIIALGLVLLVGATANAHNKTYTVRQGDKLSDIASHFKVPKSTLISVNKLSNPTKLKPGTTLRIPDAAIASKKTNSKIYTVKNGDFDWALARKFKMSMAQLHTMNPGVNWNALQPGTKLKIAQGTATSPAVAIAQSAAHMVTASVKHKQAAKIAAAKQHKKNLAVYRVKSGDCDWVIAHKLKMSLHDLHAMNTRVNFDHLQIGKLINIPASAKTEPIIAAHIQKLRSRYAKVAGDDATIRRGASTSAEKITTVDAGTPVVVLDRQGSWYKLKFPKGTVGWMRADLLKPMPMATVASVTHSRRHQHGKRYETYAMNTSKRHRSRDSRYAHDTGDATGIDRSSALLQKAYALRGTRYHWGSTNPKNGVDCSGFVTYVFKGTGVSLPRTSRSMSGVGKPVDRSSLKPGDLVFFKTHRSSRVNHVGIYAGNGKFIHSSSGHGGVRVDKLDSGYYSRQLAGARRVKNFSSGSSKSSKKSYSGPSSESIDGE